jgi:23S rRNA pseudouridine1911/1915/1917 synthase
LSCHGPGNRGALHFAAAQLMGIVVLAPGEIDKLKSFSYSRASFALATQQERQFDVFPHSHGRKQIKKLEDDAEVVASVPCEFGVSGIVERKIAYPDLPGIRRVKSAEQIEECALPATAGTSDYDELAEGNFQAYVVESADAAFPFRIDSRDPVETNHGSLETGGVDTKNQVEFQILDETEDFLAVEKPAGLLVHPTKPGGPRTLWKELCELLGYELATGGQVSLVNRIDRETSGVLLVAKNAQAARAAGMAMQRGGVRKEYVALVFGWPEWDERVVEAPIVRLGEVASSDVWLERTVHPRGAPAVTRFRVESRLSLPQDRRFSVLNAWPQTGRTHQIRVHLASDGFPLLGDKIYARGNRHYLDFIDRGWTEEMAAELWLPRHALHSSRLCLELCDRKFDWFSPLPDDLAGLIRAHT